MGLGGDRDQEGTSQVGRALPGSPLADHKPGNQPSLPLPFLKPFLTFYVVRSSQISEKN